MSPICGQFVDVRMRGFVERTPVLTVQALIDARTRPLDSELVLETPAGVTIRDPIAAGKNVIRVGEDVTAGREVLSAGRQLRPQDVGLIASVGVAEVRVVRRPRVAVLATGDELLPPGCVPHGF